MSYQRLGLLMILVAALSGCAQFQWQKDGATQDEFNRDTYQCQMEAAQIYPTALVQQQLTAGYSTPAQTTCNGTENVYGSGNYAYGTTSTNCTTMPGTYVPPATYNIDANANNRTQAAKACLYAMGYQLVRVDKRQDQPAPAYSAAPIPSTPTHGSANIMMSPEEDCRKAQGLCANGSSACKYYRDDLKRAGVSCAGVTDASVGRPPVQSQQDVACGAAQNICRDGNSSLCQSYRDDFIRTHYSCAGVN